MKKEPKKIKNSVLVLAGVVILTVYIILIAVLLYSFDVRGGLVNKTTQILPYPAATAGTAIIRMSELKNQLDSVRKFYENQDFSQVGFRVDFNTPEGKSRLKIKEKNILNKLIENNIIENEAKKRGISLNSQSVSQEVTKKLEQYGNKDEVITKLDSLYGWTIADFEKKMVKPDLYKEKLWENVKNNDSNNIKSRKQIASAKEDLSKGKDFESVVAQYSQGESAKNKGDLGWFNKTEMLPEISVVVFNMEKGTTSDIIESSLGYHIIKVEDKKNENGVDMVKLKQVFVKTKGLSDWLCEKEKSYTIKIFLKGYQWNKEDCTVEFTDESLKKFEDNLINNSADDISVMF